MSGAGSELEITPGGEKGEAGEGGAAPAPDPTGSESIPNLIEHSPDYSDATNAAIRRANDLNREVPKLREELAGLQGKAENFDLINAAIQRGELVFRDQQQEPAEPAHANGNGTPGEGVGDAVLDDALRRMEAGDGEGTKIVLREMADLKRRNAELEGRLGANEASDVQARLRTGLTNHFQSQGIEAPPEKVGLLAETYAARVKAAGFELGSEPTLFQQQNVSELTSLLGLNGTSAPSTEPTPASPDTTSGRGAGLSRSSGKLEPKAALTTDDILAELRSGNI